MPNQCQSKCFSLRHLRMVAGLVSVLSLGVSAVGQKSCPLTDSQSLKAVTAWAPIATFLTTQPRCVNCHGRVNPYIEGVGIDPDDPSKDPEVPVSQIEHGGGKQIHEKTGLMDQGCKKCHNGMAPKGQYVERGEKAPEWPEDGPLPNWTSAPAFLSFVDKDPATLCRQIKRATESADGFIGHLRNDNGRTNFAGTAYYGNRGLGEADLEGFQVKPAPPSITHKELMQLGQDWLNAMGGKFQGDESCGCELTHALWSGQIHYVDQTTGDAIQSDLLDYSNSQLTTVMVTVSNGAANWHGHYQSKSEREFRHKVAHSGGVVTIEKESNDGSEGSADGTLPASVEVQIDETHGTYSISAGALIGPHGESSWSENGKNKKLGEMHWTQCDRKGCTNRTDDIGMPGLGTTAPFHGKYKDPNHIQASFYDRQEHVGSSRKGVRVQLMTVDLWRSGTK